MKVDWEVATASKFDPKKRISVKVDSMAQQQGGGSSQDVCREWLFFDFVPTFR